MWAMSSESSACTSVIERGEPRHARGLGERDVEADVRAAVVVEVGGVLHAVDALAHEREVVLGGALGGQRDRADLDRQAQVEDLAPVGAQAPAGLLSASGGSWTTNVPPPRPRTDVRCPVCTSVVIAWRSVEREIPSWSASSRSGGRRVPGPRMPRRIAVPRRSTVSSNVVGGWTGSKTAATAASRAMANLLPVRRAGRPNCPAAWTIARA